DVDHIAYLLRRRKSIEEERERMLETEIGRAPDVLPTGLPLRWASVIPLYPWRHLCLPSLCYALHHDLMRSLSVNDPSIQQIPDGSYFRGRSVRGDIQSCSRLSNKGLVFIMEIADDREVRGGYHWFALRSVIRLIKNVIAAASTFYQKTEQPGSLVVTLG